MRVTGRVGQLHVSRGGQHRERLLGGLRWLGVLHSNRSAICSTATLPAAFLATYRPACLTAADAFLSPTCSSATRLPICGRWLLRCGFHWGWRLGSDGCCADLCAARPHSV